VAPAAAIADDPNRPGSKERPELAGGIRTCHTTLSRRHVTSGLAMVKSPRHVLFYRARNDGALELLRVLHDARDFERHLPSE